MKVLLKIYMLFPYKEGTKIGCHDNPCEFKISVTVWIHMNFHYNYPLSEHLCPQKFILCTDMGSSKFLVTTVSFITFATQPITTDYTKPIVLLL